MGKFLVKQLQSKHIIRHFREEEARETSKRLKQLDLINQRRLSNSLDLKIEKNREEKDKAMRERQTLPQSLQMEKNRALKTLNYSGKSIGNDSLFTPNRSVFEKIGSIYPHWQT